jgi:hypothetical protein
MQSAPLTYRNTRMLLSGRPSGSGGVSVMRMTVRFVGAQIRAKRRGGDMARRRGSLPPVICAAVLRVLVPLAPLAPDYLRNDEQPLRTQARVEGRRDFDPAWNEVS